MAEGKPLHSTLGAAKNEPALSTDHVQPAEGVPSRSRAQDLNHLVAAINVRQNIVEAHLQHFAALDLVPHALPNDLRRIDQVIQDGLVHLHKPDGRQAIS